MYRIASKRHTVSWDFWKSVQWVHFKIPKYQKPITKYFFCDPRTTKFGVWVDKFMFFRTHHRPVDRWHRFTNTIYQTQRLIKFTQVQMTPGKKPPQKPPPVLRRSPRKSPGSASLQQDSEASTSDEEDDSPEEGPLEWASTNSASKCTTVEEWLESPFGLLSWWL